MFDVERVTHDMIEWVRNWFAVNGPGCSAVIGISGGKDSSVTAAVCCEALGRERVIGVLMPNGVQPDIEVSKALVEHLGIKHYVVNIHEPFEALKAELNEVMDVELSNQTMINIAPRMRMTALYAVSQSVNGRVANTCNLSEDWVGYSTRWGDSVGDFSPLSDLTVDEVKKVGRYLGLPAMFTDKVPSDGLCGKTDEDNLGFTYAVLDKYIRTGVCEDEATRALIDRKHRMNLFKLSMMPKFEYKPEE